MLNQVILIGRLVVVRKHNAQVMVEINDKKQFIDVYMAQKMLEVCEDIIMQKSDTIVMIKGYLEAYEGHIRVIVERLSSLKGGNVHERTTHAKEN